MKSVEVFHVCVDDILVLGLGQCPRDKWLYAAVLQAQVLSVIKGKVFLINSQMWHWLIEIRIVPGIDIMYLRIHPKLSCIIYHEE
jgi:hypothetical protein